MSVIPVIDVAALRGGDAAARRLVAAEIGAACRGIGFFGIRGHGIAPDLRKAAFDAARALFDLPDATKHDLAIRRTGSMRGYVGPALEQLDETRPGDRKEAFNLGRDGEWAEPAPLSGGLRRFNVWPPIDGWREAASAYFEAVLALAVDLHRGIAIDLGAPEEFFTPMFAGPVSMLRMLHYPPADSDVPADALGAGAHTDYGNLTILATDGVAGLEVRARDGSWVTPPDLTDGFMCNIGDCLMRWTNDIYVSTPHRVRVPRTRRYSIAFFADPEPSTPVEVLPQCITPGMVANYQPTTVGEHLRERLSATYAHLNPA